MDYSGIDEQGLNDIASLDVLSDTELKEACNSRWRALHGHDFITNNNWDMPAGPPVTEIAHHLRQYVEVMATEPDEFILLSKVYHDLRRILGDEE